MATIDLSRSASDHRKHYKSVRAQQGRLFTDDDFNENERLHLEDERRSRVDIIGPAGSPDNGFRISNPTVAAGRLNFDIAAGTFYLGGYTDELETAETYRTQRDFLTLGAFETAGGVDGIPLAAPPANATRRDAVVLETFLHPVTGVEDDETVEKALAAGDTAARMRLHRRVLCIPGNGGATCSEAWSNVKNTLTAAGLGTVNDENELVSGATLTVSFVNNGNPTDLCTPPVQLGYLGADNQAIRVQIVDSGHYTWCFDNGAPEYRVQVGAQIAGPPAQTEIQMVSLPKDQAHWPAAGQIVELLRWEAWLPNGEKIAERSGQLFRVTASYDPDTHKLRVAGLIPANFGIADVWPLPADLGTVFVYMRVWNRGSDTASPLAIPLANGDLTGTGLHVAFAGSQRRGDHWIIAARPETPDKIVPWQLLSGRAPHGVRRFYALLAIVEWTSSTGVLISDCRPTFLPLTRLRGCCTYTVGDGTSSFGQFQDIQQALDLLPTAGGEICLLPGGYTLNLMIAGRTNIRIHGCGNRTILRPAKAGDPVISIQKSDGIALDGFRVESAESHGVRAEESNNITVRGLSFLARDVAAIHCAGGERVRILCNTVTLAALEKAIALKSQAGREPAFFLQADDLLVEQNEIATLAEGQLFSPLGGIQIGGGSSLIEIRRNRIDGGNGNGITLGSIRFVPAAGGGPAPPGGLGFIPSGGISIIVDENGCIHFDPNPQPPKDPQGNPLVPRSEGSIIDFWILENRIYRMGLNGISTVAFPKGDVYLSPRVFLGTIAGNEIMKNVQLDAPPGQGPPVILDPRARAGICLGDAQTVAIRENVIAGNGKDHVDGVCGIFVYQGEDLAIESNEISSNGNVRNQDATPRPGRRGGIYIRRGAAATNAYSSKRGSRVALHISGNRVVSPLGPALHLGSAGDVVIQGNSFTAQAATFERDEQSTAAIVAAFMGGHAVRIFSLMPAAASAGGFADGKDTTPQMESGGFSVLFDTNLVELSDLVFVPFVFTAALFLGTGDVAVNNCNFRALFQENNVIMAQALVWAVSVRVNGSRLVDNVAAPGMSLFTLGIFNETSNQQAARCIVGYGFQPFFVFRGNRSLVGMGQERCASGAKTIQGQLGLSGFIAAGDPQEV